jgi:hypothetical protein
MLFCCSLFTLTIFTMRPQYYVKFNDPNDPEKPVRFRWHYNFFSDCYVLTDTETKATIELTSSYLRGQDRKQNETDTMFVTRIVAQLITTMKQKQITS